MPHRVLVELLAPIDGAPTFCIRAGAPGGRDDVHHAVCRWPGWKRIRTAGPTSTYVGRGWASTVLAMRSELLELTWTPDAREARDDVLAAAARATRALSQRPHPYDYTPPAQAKRQPMPHQLRALDAMRAMSWRTLLADDMGLGKTASACWALHDSGATRAIIVCPVSVKRNWIRELDLALGNTWHAILIDGSRTKRASQFADITYAIEDETAGIAVVINYDLLIHLTPEQEGTLNRFSADAFLICDESHALKSRKAARTKKVAQLFGGASCRLLLTGTPVRNTVEDLYSQIQIARPHTWTSYADFAKRHLTILPISFGKKTVQKVMGSVNIEELQRVVNTLQVRRKKEDVLDLPPKIRTFPDLELDDVSLRVYRAMKDYAVLELSKLDPGTNIFDPRAGSAVEAAMRCEQIAQGFCGGIPEPILARLSKTVLRHAHRIPNRPNELVFPTSTKLTWLLETISSLRAQNDAVVIYSRFNAPMQWLFDELWKVGIRTSWLHGALSSVQKDLTVAEFCDGLTDVLLCQVKMAEGWNAVRSQDCIFLGRDWSPAVNMQAEDRLHRIGQKGTVNIQIPIVDGTIEVGIDRRLASKHADAEQALRHVTIQELADLL